MENKLLFEAFSHVQSEQKLSGPSERQWWRSKVVFVVRSSCVNYCRAFQWWREHLWIIKRAKSCYSRAPTSWSHLLTERRLISSLLTVMFGFNFWTLSITFTSSCLQRTVTPVIQLRGGETHFNIYSEDQCWRLRSELRTRAQHKLYLMRVAVVGLVFVIRSDFKQRTEWLSVSSLCSAHAHMEEADWTSVYL